MENTLSIIQSDLKTKVQELVIITPAKDAPPEWVNKAQLDAFVGSKAVLVEAIQKLDIRTPDDFALAGELVNTCELMVSVVDERIDPPKDRLNEEKSALLAKK